MTEILQRLLDADPETLSQVALEIAADRDVLPSGLSSREQREAFADAVRARSVFSARTTSAIYLQEIKDAIDLAMAGGYETDIPLLRMRLREMLAWLGYTPETGFPGDDELGIPPAKPGSLRDLSSDRRIELIFETQISLARSAGQRQRGLDPARRERWPAWELIRVFRREVPRGTGDSLGWGGRWLRAGGPVVEGGRLVALKDDPVWRALGDPSLFDDAIGVETPPFAYNSGLRWIEVSREEAEALGLLSAETEARPVAPQRAEDTLPDPEISLRGMDPALRSRLVDRIRAERAAKPEHVRFSELLERETARAREAYQAQRERRAA